MSAKEFWEDDPELLWAYRKSYKEKAKVEHEYNNYIAWLNGFYVNDAISVNLHNAFGSGNAKTYFEKPFDFNKTIEEREIEQREDSIKEQLRRGKKALSKGEDK